MVYIKANERRGNVYYNVIESVWEDGKSQKRQRLYLGRLDDITPEERAEFEADLIELDPTLLPDFYEILLEHDYEFSPEEVVSDGRTIEEIEPIEAVDYGTVRALHSVAERLDLEKTLEANLEPKGGGPPLGKLLLTLIIARCLEPKSIAATVDWYELTALPELLGLPVQDLTYDALRNSLEYVSPEGMERVHETLWTRVQEHYDTPETPLYYDLTSSYFEGTECALAEFGYSREHRPDKQQIVVGVTVNEDMVPVQHDVYTGETNDSTTVEEVLDRLDELDVADPLIVGDKGVLTAPNRAYLRGDGDPPPAIEPMEYVAPMKNTQPIKDVLKTIDREAFEPVELPEGADPLAVTEIDPAEFVAEDDAPGYLPDPDDRIRWIAAYSESKAADDAEARQDKLAEALQTLETLSADQFGDDPLEKQELVEQADRTVSAAIDDMLVWNVNERGPPRLSVEVDDRAVAQAARLDGKALFETTRDADRLSPAAVGLAYRDRDAVEKFIESIKDFTDLRPHYVRLEQKVRALVFLCVLGVLLMAVLRLELEEAELDMTGRVALKKLRGVRRVALTAEGDEAVVVKTTQLTDEQAELMHVFEEGT